MYNNITVIMSERRTSLLCLFNRQSGSEWPAITLVLQYCKKHRTLNPSSFCTTDGCSSKGFKDHGRYFRGMSNCDKVIMTIMIISVC